MNSLQDRAVQMKDEICLLIISGVESSPDGRILAMRYSSFQSKRVVQAAMADFGNFSPSLSAHTTA